MDNESAVDCGYEVTEGRAYVEVAAGCGLVEAMLGSVGRVSHGLCGTEVQRYRGEKLGCRVEHMAG
jgi:hypothetical protein